MDRTWELRVTMLKGAAIHEVEARIRDALDIYLEPQIHVVVSYELELVAEEPKKWIGDHLQ